MYFNREITPRTITTTRQICLARPSRQHVDEIENENNDEKRDEYADKHAGPLEAFVKCAVGGLSTWQGWLGSAAGTPGSPENSKSSQSPVYTAARLA